MSITLLVTENTEHLENAQDLGFGAFVHGEHVSAIGLADDVICISQDIFLLNHILNISLDYCQKYHVTISPERKCNIPGGRNQPYTRCKRIVFIRSEEWE